jgi:hypothetical protein
MNFLDYMSSCNRAQVILLGPQRSGKTVLAYSVSNLGKTLGIEAEEGVHAAKDYVKASNLDIETLVKKVKNLKTGQWESMPPEKRPPIRERLKEIILKAYTGGYKYVVLDSLTATMAHFEDEYARSVGVVDLRDWGRIIEGGRSLVHDLLNGTFNLIVTCIAGAPKEGSLLEISPVLPGSLRESIVPSFNTIALLYYAKKDKRRKLVVNDPSLGCLDRFHAFGDVREVDIEGRPAEVIKTIMEAPTKVRNESSAEAEEGGPEESVVVSRPVVVPARKFVARPLGARPVIK